MLWFIITVAFMTAIVVIGFVCLKKVAIGWKSFMLGLVGIVTVCGYIIYDMAAKL